MNGYESATQARSALGGMASGGVADSPIGTQQKPRIQQQIDQLDKVLSHCHQMAGDIANCADKLLGPVPANESASNKAQPQAMTVEQRLAETIAYAEHLAARLMEASHRLNAAI